MSITSRWGKALLDTGIPDQVVKSWKSLRTAIAAHQRLLQENGIGNEVSERDRVRVNARRVGLEAPPFADEAETTFADVLGGTWDRGVGAKRQIERDAEVTAKRIKLQHKVTSTGAELFSRRLTRDHWNTNGKAFQRFGWSFVVDVKDEGLARIRTAARKT